jgi:hypothetical protein
MEPRSVWLSLAGGASVAYVFVHLLPELGHLQEQWVHEGPVGSGEGVLGWLDHHIYLVALLGFGVFYGLEQWVRRRRRVEDDGDAAMDDADDAVHHEDDAPAAPLGVFWFHIGSFAIYNALIGYLLLHREEGGTASMAIFTGAMGLHFLVNDFGLRDHHKRLYDRWGRWLLAASAVAGCLLGLAWELPGAVVAVLLAVLAGSVVLNVIKEELPEERASRFGAFAAGAGGYAVLLLLT